VFSLKNNGGFQEVGASPYSVGTRVLARYARGNEWFPGMITKIVSGGLMSIAYDDGGKETRVSCKLQELSSMLHAVRYARVSWSGHQRMCTYCILNCPMQVHAAYVKPLVSAAASGAAAAGADNAGTCICEATMLDSSLCRDELVSLVCTSVNLVEALSHAVVLIKPLLHCLVLAYAAGSSGDDSSTDSDDESYARRASQQQQQWDVVMKKPKKTSVQREVAREVASNNDKNRKKRQAKREKELIARELQRASL
jgi:hypothetical protein